MLTGNHQPFISVCIPAYKNPEYLERLLDSLAIQNYRNFEVIITDDSPDNSVYLLSEHYRQSFPLTYHKNSPALGTPENWNESIRRANGAWIKLIHDDDWLASANSLGDYVKAIGENNSAEFFFSAYRSLQVRPDQIILIAEGEMITRPESFRVKQLDSNPVTLISKNIIGPPSVVIHKNDKKLFYDAQLKWLVDIDFYIRYLGSQKAVFIDKSLVNIGLNPLQVTKSSALVPEVEIPEHFRLLEKTGIKNLENLLVYDAWWRLFRNLKIRSTNDISKAGYKGYIPPALRNIILFQCRFPYKLLRFGPASKMLMMASYSVNKIAGNFR